MKQVNFQKKIVIFICIAATQSYTMHFDPENYCNNHDPQKFWAEHIKIPSSDTKLTLLDIGSGDGAITISLLDTFPHSTIVGTDPNPTMITFAQKKYQEYKNVDWKNVSAENINYTEKFDIAVSFSALHWVDNISKALANIQCALKNDGRLYAVLAAKKLNNTFDVAVNRQLKNIKYNSRLEKNMSQLDLAVHEYDAVEFEELIKKAGFTQCSCNAKEISYTFENKTKFMNWMSAASPFHTALGELHTSFIEDVAKTYIDLTCQKEGDSVTYTDYLLYVIAQK